MTTDHQRRVPLTSTAPDQSTRVAAFAGFAAGQLIALHSDHRAFCEFPGIRELLPDDEVRRGRLAGERWLAELWARAEDHHLPEHLARRGTSARLARTLGDSR
ncbi:hypothetical protein [Mycobacterium sp.]|uniref:hypothetical protein n=1 Tax=Mycobacterium sp. TaxID=1785 RepID=UPI003F9E9AE7